MWEVTIAVALSIPETNGYFFHMISVEKMGTVLKGQNPVPHICPYLAKCTLASQIWGIAGKLSGF
jgi:hypothetical protein